MSTLNIDECSSPIRLKALFVVFGFVMVGFLSSGLVGCASNPVHTQTSSQSAERALPADQTQGQQPAPSNKKTQVERYIASSVAQPRAPQTNQNNYQQAVDSLLVLAKNQLDSNDYSAAASSIERALRINPKSTHAYRRLAEVRLAQGRFSDAEQLAQKAMAYVNFGDHIRDNEYKADLWILISRARSRNGNKVGAEKALLEAHKLEIQTL